MEVRSIGFLSTKTTLARTNLSQFWMIYKLYIIFTFAASTMAAGRNNRFAESITWTDSSKNLKKPMDTCERDKCTSSYFLLEKCNVPFRQTLRYFNNIWKYSEIYFLMKTFVYVFKWMERTKSTSLVFCNGSYWNICSKETKYKIIRVWCEKKNIERLKDT